LQGFDGGLSVLAGATANFFAGAGFDHGLADELHGLAITSVNTPQRVRQLRASSDRQNERQRELTFAKISQ